MSQTQSSQQYVMAYIEVPMIVGASSTSTDSFEIMREHMKIRFETLSEIPSLDPTEISTNNDTWKELASLLIPTTTTLNTEHEPTSELLPEPVNEYAHIPPRNPSNSKPNKPRKRERMTFRRLREKISQSTTKRIYTSEDLKT